MEGKSEVALPCLGAFAFWVLLRVELEGFADAGGDGTLLHVEGLGVVPPFAGEGYAVLSGWLFADSGASGTLSFAAV